MGVHPNNSSQNILNALWGGVPKNDSAIEYVVRVEVGRCNTNGIRFSGPDQRCRFTYPTASPEKFTSTNSDAMIGPRTAFADSAARTKDVKWWCDKTNALKEVNGVGVENDPPAYLYHYTTREGAEGMKADGRR